MKKHLYYAKITWTGNEGSGTTTYKSYKRNHTIHINGKTDIYGSAMTEYLGDGTLYNPEDLLISSVSACHMLWYLHLCADAGVIVTAYEDNAEGIMSLAAGGSGQFTTITLKPIVKVKDKSMVEKAEKLHAVANSFCFIAKSVNFPIHHLPQCLIDDIPGEESQAT